MTKETFLELLSMATATCREFATRHVYNELPKAFRYFAYLNQSFDGHPLKDDECVFPEDATQAMPLGPLTVQDVIDLLWRDGKVPEWVDISVSRADSAYTYFELLCCGRFSADERTQYYAKRGQGPFGIKSPLLPRNWTQEQGRFDLNWHSNARNM
jgi:hypothetical protein